MMIVIVWRCVSDLVLMHGPWIIVCSLVLEIISVIKGSLANK